MTRTLMIGMIFALGPMMASPAIGQDSVTPAQKEQYPARHVDQRPTKPVFKVVFWYRRADPAASLKLQAYDLRRGQYDRALVERWLNRMKTEFPAYVTLERDINLDDEPGTTEEAKLAAAIEREREQIVGARAPHAKHRPVQPSNQPPQAAQAQNAPQSRSEYRPMDISRFLHPGGAGSASSFSGGSGFGGGTFRGVPGSGGSSLSPSSSPFPIPYSRPHP